MSWVKLDDKFVEHPKIMDVGPLAGWLYICGLSYASRQLTDGFLPASVVPHLCPVKGFQKLASSLVACGLWEQAKGGYQIHDYLQYQPSAERVKAQRQTNAVRQESWKRKRNAVTNAPANAVSNGVSNAVNNAPLTPAPYPVPVPAPKKLHDESLPDRSRERGVGENQAAPAAPSPPPNAEALDEFNQLLSGLKGYEPSPIFLRQIGQKYAALDLVEEAIKIASWAKDNPKSPITQRRVINWLSKAADDGRERAKGNTRNGVATLDPEPERDWNVEYGE